LLLHSIKTENILLEGGKHPGGHPKDRHKSTFVFAWFCGHDRIRTKLTTWSRTTSSSATEQKKKVWFQSSSKKNQNDNGNEEAAATFSLTIHAMPLSSLSLSKNRGRAASQKENDDDKLILQVEEFVFWSGRGMDIQSNNIS
jgi:hypothetical protein